jgi:CRP-like cAMP-binding protein
MTKPTKLERIRVTCNIEDTLEAYCRSCIYGSNCTVQPQCVACPISGELRFYGSQIDREVIVDMKPYVPIRKVKWSQDEINTLLDHREGGMTSTEIGVLLGRTQKGVLTQLRKLRKGGVIDDNHRRIAK